jgi:hypothetical protein
VQKLTDDTRDDLYPQVRDEQIVWEEYSALDGSDGETYFYDTAWAPGTPPRQLTDNT